MAAYKVIDNRNNQGEGSFLIKAHKKAKHGMAMDNNLREKFIMKVQPSSGGDKFTFSKFVCVK